MNYHDPTPKKLYPFSSGNLHTIFGVFCVVKLRYLAEEIMNNEKGSHDLDRALLLRGETEKYTTEFRKGSNNDATAIVC